MNRLADYCSSIDYGYTASARAQPVGPRFLRITDIVAGPPAWDQVPYCDADNGTRAKFKLYHGDIVVARTGATTGVSAYIKNPPDAVFASYLVRLKIDEHLADPRFVSYFLKGPAYWGYIRGVLGDKSAQPNASAKTITQVPASFPNLAEQRAIAGVLGALDDKIEQNRRTSTTLERLARAMFRAWFVDFEPVKAKAAGETGFPGMPPPAFDGLPTRFVDSELGPVPEGWEVGKLGDHCEINARSVRKGEIDGEIEYVDISAVTIGRLEGVQRVAFENAPSRARRRIRHGDTIWSCVRPNRRSYLFIHSPPNTRIVSTGFAVLSPSDFGASYLYQVTTQPDFVDYLVSNADGSAYPAVRPEHFARAQALVPSKGVRDAFESLSMPIRDLMAALDRESESLGRLRDYLLPKLLSGQIRVESSHG